MASLITAVQDRRAFVDRTLKDAASRLLAAHAEGGGFALRSSAPPSGVARLSARRRRVPMFAVLLPSDGVAEQVLSTSLISFLNIYNTILVARLILTWFPNPPQAIVGPLSTLADPYLNAFRGLLPPLGQIDLSPILAFTVLNVFQSAATALPAQKRAAPAAGRGVRLPRLPLLKSRADARE